MILEEILASTIETVDNVRLATGENSEETRRIVNFSTVGVVTVQINGGLLKKANH